MKARANGIEIEYEIFGDEEAPAVLLIMGLGGQVTSWPMPLIHDLVTRGYRPIPYDQRDVGLSTKIEEAGLPDLAAIAAAVKAGRKPDVAYDLDDMAADAAGLLDALGIERAHVVGMSMGGMIAQLLAAAYPERVRSLTSIMSTTGNPAVPPPTDAAYAALMSSPAGTDLEAVVAQRVKAARTTGSPGYPVDEAVLRAGLRCEFERMHYPVGIARQYAAIIASGDRRARVATVNAPTMVIHGADDPLVNIAGGRDTAATIPGAKLLEVPGMGHDLPEPLIPVFLDAFEVVAREAEETE